MIKNQVTMSGRISFEPKTYDGKCKVTKWNLGYYAGKNKDGSSQYGDIQCVTFDSTIGDTIVNLGKGSHIIVCGKLAPNSYTNKDGKEVKTNVLIVDYVGMEG